MRFYLWFVTAWFLLVGPATVLGQAEHPEDSDALKWYKGNTHTHTLNSDGDSSPGEVAHWYRDHDYDFLSLTDHNYHTIIRELQREIDLENRRAKHKPFLLIPGEEVTDGITVEGQAHPLHINGVGTTRLVDRQGGESIVDVVQRCVDAIHAASGLPHVNHPNFRWALTADDLASVERLAHFEIYNGHPLVNNFGGGGRPSLEEMWDELLSRGERLYGVAVDDAHEFQGQFSPLRSNPGRGWIVVRATELTREAILEGMRRGDFYASTGVELIDVSAREETLSLAIQPHEDTRFRTYFVGRGGAVLAVDESMEPGYTLKPGDLYVRARVVSSAGFFAWTQPLFAR